MSRLVMQILENHYWLCSKIFSMAYKKPSDSKVFELFKAENLEASKEQLI